MFYFVRVNGNTLHNNPNLPSHYVPNEPPRFPVTAFNALGFCLKNGIIRIGWPDTGNLFTSDKTGALAQGYSLYSLKPAVQRYLLTFRDISVGSIVMMPDTENPGQFYMGEVIEPYHYHHDLPEEPYEYAHRLGVDWDRNVDGSFKIYHALGFGIETQGGGFWRRAFRALDEYESSRMFVPMLEAARKQS